MPRMPRLPRCVRGKGFEWDPCCHTPLSRYADPCHALSQGGRGKRGGQKVARNNMRMSMRKARQAEAKKQRKSVGATFKVRGLPCCLHA